MPMTFDGNGTITGLSAGGLPDSSIVTADIANAAITAAKLDGAQSGSAPIYGARAWVNFNGTGTVAIRASGNVSSITDNGTGDYTVNLTTAMSDASYPAAGMTNYGSFICLHEQRDGTGVDPSASALRIIAMDHPGGINDNPWIYVTFFR